MNSSICSTKYSPIPQINHNLTGDCEPIKHLIEKGGECIVGGKYCSECIKSNTCRFQENAMNAIHAIQSESEKLKTMHVSICININCKMFQTDQPDVIKL